MIDIDSIRGWESGGALSGKGLTILGKNTETGVICYIRTSGPGRHTLFVGHYNEMGKRYTIEQGFDDLNSAKIRAAEFMNGHRVVDVDTSSSSAKLTDGSGNRIRP